MFGGDPIASPPLIDDDTVFLRLLPVSPIIPAQAFTTNRLMAVELGLDLLWDTEDLMIWDDDTNNIGWEQ